MLDEGAQEAFGSKTDDVFRREIGKLNFQKKWDEENALNLCRKDQ